MPKSAVEPINSCKNKLNNEIILIFNPNPNACVLYPNLGPMHCSQDPQTSFFRKNFIKNGSNGTIHTFKNYLVIMFSVFSNKQYPNRPLLSSLFFFSFFFWFEGCLCQQFFLEFFFFIGVKPWISTSQRKQYAIKLLALMCGKI